MKRLLLSLALLLGAFLAVMPQAAQAQAISCVNITAGTTWPNGPFTQTCSNVPPTDANLFQNAVGNSRYVQIPNFFPNARFYIFLRAQDYTSYATTQKWTNVTTPGPKDFGVTDTDANGVPIRSAVFEFNMDGEQNAHGSGNGTPGNPNSAAFEAGNWINIIYANVSPGSNFQSATTDFINQVTTDWLSFNKLTACGSSSIFGGHEDENGNYICSGNLGSGSTLSIPYSSLSQCKNPGNPSTCNQTVLETAWPRFFGSDSGIYKESMASISGLNNLGAYPKDYDYFFENAFACTGAYNTYVNEFDNVPTSLPTGCTVPAPRVFCTRTFDGTTNFPGAGYIYNCFPNDPNNSENHLSSNIANLGLSPTSALITTLKGGNYQIYVFHTYADYAAVFKLLNLPIASNQKAAGYTLPLSNGYRYSVLFTLPEGVTVAFNDTQMAEAGAHESGHAIDFIKGWTTNSGNPAFDTAIQWDFLDLDYNNRTQTDPKKPCGGTDKKGNPYSGPLVNVVDPTTLKQFCSGQTLESKWGTSNATTILRNAKVDSGYWSYLAKNTKVGQFTYPGGWSEWYAQSFAIQVNLKTNGGGVAIVQDQVVNNTFFQCTAGTGSSGTIHGFLWYIYNSQAVALPSTCTGKLPTWWTVLR